MTVENSLPNDVLKAIPNNLPEPIDDGACDHLTGMKLPEIELISNHDKLVNLAHIPDWTVLYIYPMTGKPGIQIPLGWADIPGAAGCTPQSCSFRDSYQRFKAMNVTVFGLSAQSTTDQREAAERLSLPYKLLSDFELKFASALNLPLLKTGELKLIRRITLICLNGIIQKHFYPVFPPDKNASDVVEWLVNNTHNKPL